MNIYTCSRSKKAEGVAQKNFFLCWVMLQCQRVRDTLGIHTYLRWERVRESGREKRWESRRIKVGSLVGSHHRVTCSTWSGSLQLYVATVSTACREVTDDVSGAALGELLDVVDRCNRALLRLCPQAA